MGACPVSDFALTEALVRGWQASASSLATSRAAASWFTLFLTRSVSLRDLLLGDLGLLLGAQGF